MKKILIVGHSHIVALQTAKTVDPTFEFYSIINQQQMDEISELDHDNYRSVIFSIMGNNHNVFGLLNHTQPFDFYFPENLNLPINSNARLLPVNLVAAILRRNMSSIFTITSQLLQYFKQPIYQIESPPPIPSELHIQKYPGVFKDKIIELGVSPAPFRYKLWRLHSKIVSDNCQRLGISFIDVPTETQDEEGCLQERYWNTDPTHGNALYGDIVINQIRAIHGMEIK